MGQGVTWSLSILGILIVGLPLLGLLWRIIDRQAWQDTPNLAVREALILSLVTTLIALGIIILLGTPLAYQLSWRRSWLWRGINVLVELPIVLPPAVAGLALLLTFGRRGLLGGVLAEFGITVAFSMVAVVLAQVFVAIPFYIRAAQLGFNAISSDYVDAAKVDGANGLQIFWQIIFPLALKSLLSGAILSWARALGEFGATIVFAGNLAGETRTMPLLVYSILERDLNAALWTAVILIGLAIFAIGITRYLSH